MRTKEELNALKEEVETVSRKPYELTEEELAQVSGGNFFTDIMTSVRQAVESPVVEPLVPDALL